MDVTTRVSDQKLTGDLELMCPHVGTYMYTLYYAFCLVVCIPTAGPISVWVFVTKTFQIPIIGINIMYINMKNAKKLKMSQSSAYTSPVII